MLYLKGFIIALGLFWGLLLPWRGEAAIIGSLEGPVDRQVVSGIGVIRGWAFAETTGTRINQTTLRIDDNQPLIMPCCSARKDVQNAYPQYPAENTLNSGYGFTFNYGNLSAGPHQLVVEIQDSSGAQSQYIHHVTVVKPGDFAYIDQVDLTAASASREGQDLRLSGLQVRDKASQQVSRVDARLRWFANQQGLGIVEAAAIGAGSLNPVGSVLGAAAQGSAAAEIPYAALESPANGETGAGIAIIRGWVIAPAGRSIQRAQLLVDGEPTLDIPCCSQRSDVAAAYPNEPNAANSGFGTTFNYGNLAPGVHRLTIEIEDSAGAQRRFIRGMITRRPGNFTYLNQLNFGNAQVRIAGGELVVTGAIAVDQATGQSARNDLRYRWNVAAQAFVLTEESLDTLTVTNINCAVNGDTSSAETLRANPGADGLSLAEAIAVINQQSAANGRIAVDFAAGGKLSCSFLLFGKITINGDTDGDGVPNVIVDGSLATSGSDITVQGLSIQDDANGQAPLGIGVSIGRSASDIAFLTNKILARKDVAISLGSSGPHVDEPTSAGILAASEDTALRRVLMSNNQIKSEANGVFLIDIDDDVDPLLTQLTYISILNNKVTCDGYGDHDSYRWCDAITFVDQHSTKETVIEAIVNENEITNHAPAGSNIFTGNNYLDNPVAASTKLLEISGNIIANDNQGDYGILLRGGYTTPSRNNLTKAKVVENTIRGRFSSGIYSIAGADTASSNTMIADIKNNHLDLQLSEGSEGAIAVQGGIYASSNIADATVSHNAISASRQDAYPSGVLLSGGVDCRGCNPPVPSLNNLVTGDILFNTVQDDNPADPNIAVFGAEKHNPSSEVQGNQALVNIIHAVPERVVCEDNVPGNTAQCTIHQNQNEGGASVVLKSHSDAVPASLRMNQQLTAYQITVIEKERQLREKAAKTGDNWLRNQYLEIADRLHNVQDKLALKIAHDRRGGSEP